MADLDLPQWTTKVDDDNDDDTRNKIYESHEAIMFCIGLSEKMLEPAETAEGNCQFVEILNSLDDLMSQLVITRPSTGIGCYIYNTSIQGADENGIFELFPTRDINVRSMKTLADALDRLKKTGVWEEWQISKRDTALESLFTKIQDEFLRDIADQKSFNSKRVFLFTNVDNPAESSDRQAKLRLRKLVADMNDAWINFVPFFIGSKNDPFNTQFFSSILHLTDTSTGYSGPNVTPTTIEQIKRKVQDRKETKRVIFQTPFILDMSSEFIISVKGYSVSTHEKPNMRYKLVYENQGYRTEAHSKRLYMDAKTGQVVKDNLVKVFPYGDISIPLSEDEIHDSMELLPGYDVFLKLIGFKSRNLTMKYYNNIDKSFYITPDDSKYEGSTRALSSLYKAMLKSDSVAIIWGKVKSNANYSLYILYPSQPSEKNDIFYLHRIPFLDEIRKFPTMMINESVKEDQDYKDIYKITNHMITHLECCNSYRPEEYKNPSISRYYRVLHDYALQKEVKSETEDTENDATLRKLITNDDTLKVLYEVRKKIIESAKIDNNNNTEKLSDILQIWNILYQRVLKDDSLVSFAEPSKKKNNILNL